MDFFFVIFYADATLIEDSKASTTYGVLITNYYGIDN